MFFNIREQEQSPNAKIVMLIAAVSFIGIVTETGIGGARIISEYKLP